MPVEPPGITGRAEHDQPSTGPSNRRAPRADTLGRLRTAVDGARSDDRLSGPPGPHAAVVGGRA